MARSPADFPAAPNIAAVLSGDRAAARALVIEMTPRVRNLVRYLVRNDVDVDDIAQEAMVAVLKNLGDYRDEGAFYAWVDRITARTTFKILSRRKRRREEPLDLERAEPTHDAFGEFHSRRRLVALLDRL
ncbi:MAG: polymerase sigma-70 factor, subfamily, partial [Labilithrix sp.]|nr:polymerase sigma-70 factor, subfamily [Labilithrix sp.]